MLKNVLITAGPTYEPIDPIRFIGNRSSGKQGIAIAKVFAENNYNVNLIIGPINDNLLNDLPKKNINISHINTALEMYNECLKYIKTCDIAIHTAAVSDFRPEKILDHKLKKNTDESINDIKFVENPDILATFGTSQDRPKLVIGFAAETNDIIENAKKKLIKKKCDYIIANDVSNNKVFGKDYNKVYIVSKTSIVETETLKKDEIAKKILDLVNNF